MLVFVQRAVDFTHLLKHLIELSFGQGPLVGLRAVSEGGVVHDDLTFVRRPVLGGVIEPDIGDEPIVIGDAHNYVDECGDVL